MTTLFREFFTDFKHLYPLLYIFSLLEFEIGDSGSFIVMPFYPEGNLDQAIEKRNGKPFDMAHVAYLFMQLCRALEYIHSRNIIHRDVKVSFSA